MSVRQNLNGKIKIMKFIKNLFKNYKPLNEKKGISCSCNNGIIDCPGCKGADERERLKYICAGCHGKGEVVCGKCGGKHKI